MIRNVNDGSTNAPRWVPFLNMGTLADLPEWSQAPTGEPDAVFEAIKAAGFRGVQGGDPDLAKRVGLLYAGGGRINEPADAQGVAKQNVDQGALCATVHMGWGIEDDVTIDRLVDATLSASAKHDLPIYIETHRATVTQDIWRSVQICHRHPDVRFNGDFSHWYTGLEMPYGTVELKTGFAQPVFDRVRFMHGRIGSSGSMQVHVGDTLDEAMGRDYVQHFVQMWTLCIKGFLEDAKPGDLLCFAPEILASKAHYARMFPDAQGQFVEESDRWLQALLYLEIFQEAWDRVTG